MDRGCLQFDIDGNLEHVSVLTLIDKVTMFLQKEPGLGENFGRDCEPNNQDVRDCRMRACNKCSSAGVKNEVDGVDVFSGVAEEGRE